MEKRGRTRVSGHRNWYYIVAAIILIIFVLLAIGVLRVREDGSVSVEQPSFGVLPLQAPQGGQGCALNEAYWDKTEVTEGDNVLLTVESTGDCDGQLVKIELYEDDLDHEPRYEYIKNLESISISNDVASLQWISEGRNDPVLWTNPPYPITASEYAVKASLVSNSGVQVWTSNYVTVNNREPEARFTYSPTSPKIGTLVRFDGSLSDDGGDLEYMWDFGDGQEADGEVVTHIFDAEDTYEVTLTVRDWADVEDDYSLPVDVAGDASENLVLWYMFDDSPDDGVTDSSGKNHNGVCSGNCPSYLASGDRNGNGAYEFYGDSDKRLVSAGSHSDFDFGGLTLAAWVKPEGKKTDQRIVHKRSGVTESVYGLQLDRGVLEFRIGECSGGASQFGTTEIPLNSWSHVVGTFNQDSNTVVIYINGESVETFTGVDLNLCAKSGYPVEVGGHSGRDKRFFDGMIDDVRVYNKALSESEISGIYGGNNPPEVDAGSDKEITLPEQAFLDATVTDDGNYEVLWEKVSGPGTVTFGDAGMEDTTASFDLPGLYVLKITADDGEFQVSDTVNINVEEIQSSENLVLWYMFDDSPDDGVTDSSGKNHNGVCSGNCPNHLISGSWDGSGAYEFYGDSDKRLVSAGSHSDFDFTEELTLAAWIKPSEFSTDQRVVHKRLSQGESVYAIQIDKVSDSSGRLEFKGASCTGGASQAGSKTIPLNEWSHVAVTFDSASNTVVFYIDGLPVETVGFSRDLCSNSLPVEVGGHSDRNVRWFDGMIDDVRVYNKALDESGIAQIYGGSPGETECSDGIDNDEDGKLDINDPGCSNTEDNSENQDPEAVADANPGSGYAPLRVQFDASDSRDPEEQGLTYLWEGEEIGRSDKEKPVHTFEEAGSYEVVLTVTDRWGAKDSDPVTVEVLEDDGCRLTNAYWSQDSAIQGEVVGLTIEGLNCDGEVLDVELIEDDDGFGDDLIGSLPNMVFSGNTATGSWTAEWIKDGDGITNNPEMVFIGYLTDDEYVRSQELKIINQEPIAVANADKEVADVGETIRLDGSSSEDHEESIVEYMWDFGDGSDVEYGEVVTHSFNREDNYQVTLTIRDAGDLTDEDVIDIEVFDQGSGNNPPQVDAGSDKEITLPEQAFLDATVTDDGNYEVLWEKVSGPGGVNILNPRSEDTSISFTQSGDYVFKITADDGEFQVSDTVRVRVNPISGDAQCSNGGDDDGDGLVDMADPDCRSPSDDSEANLIGTTYFFSTSGSDSNSGLSPGNAKKTIVEANRLMNNAGPGDTFAFKRGETWRENSGISLNNDDAVGTPDDYVVVTAYGSGSKPTFDISGGNSILYISGVYSGSGPAVSYVKFENLRLTTESVPRGSGPIGVQITESGNAIPHDLIFSNLVVEDTRSGFDINLATRNVVVENSVIRNNWDPSGGSKGIFARYSTNLVVRNNLIENNGLVDDTGDHNTYLSHCTNCVYENNIVRGHTSGLKIAVGDGLLVKGNKFSGISDSLMTIGGRSDEYLKNVVIENNILENGGGSGFVFKHQGSTGKYFGRSYNENVVIRNNFFDSIGSRSNKAMFSIIGGNHPTHYEDIYVYNNLFYLPSTSIVGFRVTDSDLVSNTNMQILNNMFIAPEGASGNVFVNSKDDWDGIDLDNNIYYNLGRGTLISSGSRDYSRLSDFRDDFPQFEGNGEEGDPKLVNLGSDFHLTSGSDLAIDEGFGTNKVPFDFDGIMRPQGNGWDIGPYEFVSGGNNPPQVDAGSDKEITLPEQAFLDATVTDDGNYGVLWSLVDGPAQVEFQNAEEEDTFVTFTLDGLYTLRLTATDDIGQEDYDDVKINVNPQGSENQDPVADFSAPGSAEVGEVVTFDASFSYDPDGEIVSWEWDFGDGQEADGEVVTHIFDAENTYNVALTVRDNDGAQDVIVKPISIYEPGNICSLQNAYWSQDSAIHGDLLTITIEGQDCHGEELRLELWEDDDALGEEFIEDLDSIVFSQDIATGEWVAYWRPDEIPVWGVTDPEFKVKAYMISDESENIESNEVTIVNQAPTAVAESDKISVDIGEVVTFDGSASYDLEEESQDLRYEWDFGDGDELEGIVVQHEFSKQDTYVVTLTVTDLQGKDDADTVEVTVTGQGGGNEPPVARFSAPGSAEVNTEVFFDASASSDDNGIVQYRWDWDNDGNDDDITTQNTIRHTFTSVRNYDVKLTVVDGDGLNDDTIQGINIYEPGQGGECNDGIDNDGDGLVDWGYDLGCYNKDDATESSGTTKAIDNGWTVFEPSSDTNFVFVSTSGNDGNCNPYTWQEIKNLNGDYNQISPCRTLRHAGGLIRNGKPDWLLLKRGDTWNDEDLMTNSGWWIRSGKNEDERIVVAGYGDLEKRPTINRGSWGGKDDLNVENVALVGLHFKGDFGSAHTALMINYEQSASNFLFEDLKLEQAGISTGNKGTEPDIRNLELRRSVIFDNWRDDNHGSGHVQGMFVRDVTGFLVEENVFDQNGWSPTDPDSRTTFNHNIYFTTFSDDLTAIGNIFTRASASGLQARAGGIVDNNLFYKNPSHNNWGWYGGTNPPYQGGVTGAVRNNVYLDHDQTAVATVGIAIGNVKSGIIENNIMKGSKSDTGMALQINADTSNGWVGVNDLTVRNNIIYDMKNRVIAFWDTSFNNVKIQNNNFQSVNTAKNVAWFQDLSSLGNKISFSGNNYYRSDDGGKWFWFGGGKKFTEWVSASGEDGATQNDVDYVDSDRDLNYYAKSIGLINENAFLEEARKQGRFNWRPELTAGAVNDYIRAGFQE